MKNSTNYKKALKLLKPFYAAFALDIEDFYLRFTDDGFELLNSEEERIFLIDNEGLKLLQDVFQDIEIDKLPTAKKKLKKRRRNTHE